MGFFSKIGDFVEDNFLGGAEKKAGKAAAKGQAEAAGYYTKLLPRAQTRFNPYQAAGDAAITQYTQAIRQPSTPLPDFSYTGQAPTFNYNGNIPAYSYNGSIPELGFQDFSYGNDVPDAALPTYTNAVGNFQFDPSQLESNPAYQFRLQQGIQAVNRGAGKSGNLNAGNRLIALNDYAQGAASQEYGNEFARQLQASQENYGRGVTDYGINRDTSMAQIGLDRDREASQYGRALTAYDIGRTNTADVYAADRARESDQYNRGLTAYDIARGNEATQYGRAQDQYGYDTQREATQFDRTLKQYELAYGKNSDEYARVQQYLTQLGQLAQMGYDVNNLLTQLDLNATTGRANARIGQGTAQAAGMVGQSGAIRGTIGDIASGIGAVSEQGGISKILSGFL